MIDFHSHFLPAVDDGSADVSEGLVLLQMLADQGIQTVVATPHFYANRDSVQSFTERRAKGYNRLMEQVAPDMPKPEILLGAEVRYYAGISRLPDLKQLCAGDTNLLLLEMTIDKWTEYMVKEVVELANRGDITVVIAHLERYMDYQSEHTLRRLRESGVRAQFNTGFFLDLRTKRRAISMMREGRVHLLGSDCHGVQNRPPRFDKLYKVLSKKLGNEFLDEFHAYGYSLLQK